MVHVLMFFYILILEIEATFKMVLIFGQPFDWKTYSNRTATIAKCMDYCIGVNTCVAVYVEKGAKNCSVFNVGQIQKLRETSSSAGNKIAMKMELPSNICAKSFNSNSMKGSVTSTTSYLAYKIHLGSDGKWIFTTTQVLNCPDKYRLFTRPKGLWCIGVISVNLCISQEDTSARCVLSGLQTMDETNYIYGTGQALLKKDPTYVRYGYWVNGKRKASCSPPNIRSGSTCDGINEFHITDPLISAYSGYRFASREPSGIVTQSKTSNCLNLLLGKNTLFGVDDNGCTIPNEGNDICYKGYVCGVQPSPPE